MDSSLVYYKSTSYKKKFLNAITPISSNGYYTTNILLRVYDLRVIRYNCYASL